MTSPLDRAGLADALAPATVETLTMDARVATQPEVRLNARYEPDVVLVTVTLPQVTLARLAALALACAELSEAPTGVQITTDHTEELVASVQVWGEADICAPTLPAALAALLKGDQ